MNQKKEENAVILDFLPYGYPLDGKMMPIAQAIGEENLTLLQLIPRKGITLQLKEQVYIGEGKREKIYYILGRLPLEKITENAKIQLEEFVDELIEKDSEKYIKFFNEASAINTRMHQIELLPGYGKKHMKEILEERDKKEFESLKDLKERIPSLPDPKSAIQKRIINELTGKERYRIFIL